VLYILVMNRENFFKKGNKYSQGRPLGAKNILPKIRSRILRVVARRIMHEKDLESVTTTDLLKFLATIMPKDYELSLHPPQVNYISNVPREPERLEVTTDPLISTTTSDPLLNTTTSPLISTTTSDAISNLVTEPTSESGDNGNGSTEEGTLHSGTLHPAIPGQE
jgi:hypothetical protein